MRPILFAVLISLLHFTTYGQAKLLQSGPMLGYSEMREVALWLQTKEPAKVKIGYWNINSPSDVVFTETVKTSAETAFTAHLIAAPLEPGQRYGYKVYINDKAVELPYATTFQTQALWQWRTDPPAFKLAVGSCAYVNETQYDRPNNAYGGDYHIYTNMHKQQPDVMLWLGDNTYLREADWNSRTGILHRNTHTRSLPELQPLLASTHNYAIWDDHDFGPDDSDASFIHKDLTLEAFKLFWANPSYGLNGGPGITTQFQWADVDFFLLDNRYFRTSDKRKTGEPTILGKEQLEWLINALAYSRAPFKVVAIGGQVLNPAAVFENYAAYGFGPEREYLLKRIEEEKLKNVIFITGDRHHTELCQYVNGAGNTIYDLTVSPLTSGPSTNVKDENPLRVEGTLCTQRNFGLLEFSGPRTQRKLTIRIFDVNGTELWNRSIDAVK